MIATVLALAMIGQTAPAAKPTEAAYKEFKVATKGKTSAKEVTAIRDATAAKHGITSDALAKQIKTEENKVTLAQRKEAAAEKLRVKGQAQARDREAQAIADQQAAIRKAESDRIGLEAASKYAASVEALRRKNQQADIARQNSRPLPPPR